MAPRRHAHRVEQRGAFSRQYRDEIQHTFLRLSHRVKRRVRRLYLLHELRFAPLGGCQDAPLQAIDPMPELRSC